MRWSLAFVALGCIGLAACADILGIDDGNPRNDAAADVAPPGKDGSADASPDVPFRPLVCSTKVCNFAVGEACCRTGASAYQCVTSAAACTGMFIPCDRPSQCPTTDAGKQTCCTNDILNEAGTDYVAQSVACTPAATCTPTPNHYILCGDDDASADCPGDAATCVPSTSTLPPFYICR